VGLENPIHILILAVIILLVFGSSQLPKIARSAGKHAREAKDGVASFKGEFDNAMGGDDNPLNEVADTLRSANPKTIVRDTVNKAATPTKKPPPAP
jgi:sec-independent protein translocase protein TatA